MRCPNGHPVEPARGLTCMVRAGYYWCGKCESVPGGRSMAGGPMMGMYYSPSLCDEEVVPSNIELSPYSGERP
jgi:hypothetical protein